ncbi:MAG: glycoside hydrolase family 97 catalytic domain-containing protein [Kiritimatiellia bacterium]
MKLGLLILLCAAWLRADAGEVSLTSPGQVNTVSIRGGEHLTWAVTRGGQTLLDGSSRLGLKFAGKPLATNWTVVAGAERRVADEFATPLYKKEKVSVVGNEVKVAATAQNGEKLELVCRAYDNAIAWRYVLPGEDAYAIEQELTTWAFRGEVDGVLSFHDAWGKYLFGGTGSEEGGFYRLKLSALSRNGVATVPVLVEARPDCRVALCEADLTDWAALAFRTVRSSDIRRQVSTLAAELAVTRDEPRVAVRGKARRWSPWRVLLIAENEVALLDGTDVIMALNPPPEGDFSWVKPGATGWDWWADHAGVAVFPETDDTLRQIDFAAEMGWPYHTIDAGWYGRPVKGDAVKLDPRAGYDLPRILAHAKEQGVGIWLWFWWDVIDNPLNGLEETFAKFERWGVKGVKIDFMGREDQWMVNWYEKIVRAAAKHRLMVNFHAAYHPTGMNRTWPNQITREGIRGNEMNKYYGWITPRHMATLPFTRFLTGPADYTPGGFKAVYSQDFVPQYLREQTAGNNVRIFPEEVGTRAHALALCFAYDSPLVTLCDWPCNYRDQPGVEALRNLPTVWKNTVVLRESKLGEYYGVMREAYDGSFCFAAFTVNGREVEVPLDQLGDRPYAATIYADDLARTPQDPNAIRIEKRQCRSGDTLKIRLCDEGGAVVIFQRP